jgi:hypothetical protein
MKKVRQEMSLSTVGYVNGFDFRFIRTVCCVDCIPIRHPKFELETVNFLVQRQPSEITL